MKTLLRIDSSPRHERSHSRRLTEAYVAAWLRSHPENHVVHRDLSLDPIPFVTETWIAAAFSEPASRTSEQRDAIALSDQLIDELMAADEIVIGAPMYNFSITASLKAWIDQIVRVGRTVAYPSYTGLVSGKKVVVITTRGGAGLDPHEPMAHLDSQVPYLRQILGFIGISNISVVYAGGLAAGETSRQASLDLAQSTVERLASGLEVASLSH